MSATERQERLEDGSAPVDDTSLGHGAETPIADVRTRCKSPVRMFFAPEGDPFKADTLCACGHPRREHNFLWNACRGCR